MAKTDKGDEIVFADDPLATAEDLLTHLLRVNKHGVWFVVTKGGSLALLPRWLRGYCERLCPQARKV